jgi:hypothetical protein
LVTEDLQKWLHTHPHGRAADKTSTTWLRYIRKPGMTRLFLLIHITSIKNQQILWICKTSKSVLSTKKKIQNSTYLPTYNSMLVKCGCF